MLPNSAALYTLTDEQITSYSAHIACHLHTWMHLLRGRALARDSTNSGSLTCTRPQLLVWIMELGAGSLRFPASWIWAQGRSDSQLLADEPDGGQGCDSALRDGSQEARQRCARHTLRGRQRQDGHRAQQRLQGMLLLS